MRRNYHRKLRREITTENYEEKLSQEIMRRNYHRKLSQSANEGTVMSPFLLEGNVLRTAHIMWGNH
jgi:hypothetical protein